MCEEKGQTPRQGQSTDQPEEGLKKTSKGDRISQHEAKEVYPDDKCSADSKGTACPGIPQHQGLGIKL